MFYPGDYLYDSSRNRHGHFTGKICPKSGLPIVDFGKPWGIGLSRFDLLFPPKTEDNGQICLLGSNEIEADPNEPHEPREIWDEPYKSQFCEVEKLWRSRYGKVSQLQLKLVPLGVLIRDIRRITNLELNDSRDFLAALLESLPRS